MHVESWANNREKRRSNFISFVLLFASGNDTVDLLMA